ncbi:MAG: hypothetical protein ABS69_09370 [Nitrosomonadales bacterium SCN 54-20]|nr:MAG: hypothetical protein ABS69_09370 [Nitrosomonadales bacterium SCN 54-20]
MIKYRIIAHRFKQGRSRFSARPVSPISNVENNVIVYLASISESVQTAGGISLSLGVIQSSKNRIRSHRIWHDSL